MGRAHLTQEHQSEAGRRSGEARRHQAELVAVARRLAAESRAAQGLPETVSDVAVLEQVAAALVVERGTQ